MAQSPASSPRLPSPPPMAEDQVGATSPGHMSLDELDKIGQAAALEETAARRIRPGTRAEAMHEGPPLVEFSEIDSAFQLTEHLKALFANLTASPSHDASIPITRATALQLATPPPGVDRGIWLYELCRLLVARANTILVSLFADSPACSASTCPEMRASEWQYLCAAHDPPKSCCAIDYCCHTLDWSATQLTSSKLFPSRLALGTESASSSQQLRKMTEIFRRVYRIFAHAWFQHRDVFWKVEGRTGLYVFFKTVCDEFRLIPEDSYTVPAEAEGGGNDDDAAKQPASAQQLEEKRVLRREDVEDDNTGKDTQKRHHRSMPDRQNSVSTVIHEEVEEDDSDHETEEELRRGAVVELLPPAELESINAAQSRSIGGTEAIDHAVVHQEVKVEAHPVDGAKETQAKTETVVKAPISAEPDGLKETTKEVDLSAVATETAAAGDADEASKTVGD